MKTLAAALLALALAVSAAHAQQYAPEIPYESVPDFFRLPTGVNFGEVAGVATNSKGNVFVFTRSSPYFGPAFGEKAAQLYEFSPTGDFIREHGRGLYSWSFAHSVKIAPNDDIWTVDKGSNMIVRMNPEGRVVWVFGRREEATHAEAYEHHHPDPPLPAQDASFRQPTDVSWDSQGNIFITDGYINSRVAKYDMNGDWERSWGEPGNGQSQFNTPHSIAVDSNDNVYVGDRGNARIQVFDTNGRFLRVFSVATPIRPGSKSTNGSTPTDLTRVRGNGAPNSLCIPPGSNIIYVGESTFPGRIIKATLQGEVLGTIGNSGRNLGEFSGAHGLACPDENTLYVAETSNSRAQKIVLYPQRLASQSGSN